MHGASGLEDGDIREAIKLGVTKINIDTLIKKTFVNDLQNIESDVDDYRKILKTVMADIQTKVGDKIRLFSSNNEA